MITVTLSAEVWASVVGCLQSDLESDSYEEHPGLLDEISAAIIAIETAIEDASEEAAS